MLTELESVMNALQHNLTLQHEQKFCAQNKEQGIALLGTVIVLSLVMGLLVWGTLAMTRQGMISAYQTNNANQARTAALIGISALTQYAQNQYAPTASAASSGNGAVAAYVPVGTNAATSIAFSAPYMAATVSAVVTANTFSASPSPNGVPEHIIIMSQGASGLARGTAVAILGLASSGGTAGSGQGNIPVNLTGNTTFSGKVQLNGGNNSSLSTNGSLSSSGSFSGFNTVISTKSMSLSGSSGSG